jgi:DNA-directed RNA polymerase specialized sigma subunit
MDAIFDWSLWAGDECPRGALPAKWQAICELQRNGEQWPAQVAAVEKAVCSLPDIRKKVLMGYVFSHDSVKTLAKSLNISVGRYFRLLDEAKATVESHIR